MKKDTLFWSTLIAFGSFFLMIVFFMYTTWKTNKEADERRARMKALPPTLVTAPLKDFSGIKTVRGDDGAEMVFIPPGPFLMGSPPNQGNSDERPQHATFIPGYYIDLKEVTQEQFAVFSQATGVPMPVVPVFEDDLGKITQPELPVVGVSWVMALGYCKWADKRLPTEAEWEKAAGGEASLKWPWGPEPAKGSANLMGEEDGFEYLAPPGSFESGRSPYGLYDMVGNVSEWTADWYAPDYYSEAPFQNPKGAEEPEGKFKFRVYRGGSWNDSIVTARVAKRFTGAPHQTSAVIGFRCVKSAGEEEPEE
ncbi:MAG TPA: SUMF1/EgtB/PvdO family nonheme iron enzyme [Nitrospiria bacterium]